MPYTDTPVKKLIVNVLTEEQYSGIENPSDSELYLITDDAAVSAGTGLSATVSSGTTTINHSNSTTAKTTQAIYPVTIDAQGHISSSGTGIAIGSGTTTFLRNDGTWAAVESLPTVTSTDNGKVLTVVSGEWAAAPGTTNTIRRWSGS